MKNKLITITAVLSLLMSGCGKIYVLKPSSYEYPDQIGSFKIDDTFDLFVRTVDVSEKPAIIGKPNTTLRMLTVNVPQGHKNKKNAATDTSKLIEIEYLFVSCQYHTVLYISTVADRYEKRYTDSGFAGITRPNVADFRVFLVGSVENNLEQFSFFDPDNQHSEVWTLHKEKDSQDQTLDEIIKKRYASYEEGFPLRVELQKRLVFKKQEKDSWHIIFREGNVGSMETGSPPEILLGKPDANHYTIGIKLDKHIFAFAKKYMIYSPQRNLDFISGKEPTKTKKD